MKTREQAVELIKKLLRKAQSAEQMDSLNEAEIFSAKANQLILDYNLSQQDVAFDEVEEVNRFANWGGSERVTYKDNQSGDRWRLHLVSVLAKHNLCTTISHPYAKEFTVYGNLVNVDITVWLYYYISENILTMAKKAHVNRTPAQDREYGPNGRYSFLKDFLIGAVVGIDRMMKKLQTVQQQSLICVNEKDLAEFVNISLNGNVRPGKSAKLDIKSAFHDGVKAGEKFDITNKKLK